MSDNKTDENKEILELIQKRMELGIERYGHGLRVNDNTQKWGTSKNSWTEMALEEALDGMIYLSASIIRILKKEE